MLNSAGKCRLTLSKPSLRKAPVFDDVDSDGFVVTNEGGGMVYQDDDDDHVLLALSSPTD